MGASSRTCPWGEVTLTKSSRGKWIELADFSRTLPGSAWGRVRLSVADNGIAYLDDVKLEKLGKESPTSNLPPCTITEKLAPNSPGGSGVGALAFG